MDENKVGLSYKCAPFTIYINSHCAMLASKSFPYSLFVACEHKHAQPGAPLPFLQLAVTSKVFSIQRVSAFVDTGEQVSVDYESVSISVDSGGKDLGAKCPEVS
ncbi:hypothetical protein QQF64_004840 [Cirrhinus molitorella]|uniref:Uncharacterized protein n=1 Tax=Cirrhinus molitorella TaxID=172907 RepID=A0ABR3MHF1_9TELE